MPSTYYQPPVLEAESFRVDIVKGGSPGDFGRDLTTCYPDDGRSPFLRDSLSRLGILYGLQEWLHSHGAFTPGSGVWVRVIPSDAHPDDVANFGQLTGELLDTRHLTTITQAAGTEEEIGLAVHEA